jgi:hypothetical protein
VARVAATDAEPTRTAGRWTLGADGVLRVRWDDRLALELRAGDNGTWTGSALRAGEPGVGVTLADEGCAP